MNLKYMQQFLMDLENASSVGLRTQTSESTEKALAELIEIIRLLMARRRSKKVKFALAKAFEIRANLHFGSRDIDEGFVCFALAASCLTASGRALSAEAAKDLARIAGTVAVCYMQVGDKERAVKFAEHSLKLDFVSFELNFNMKRVLKLLNVAVWAEARSISQPLFKFLATNYPISQMMEPYATILKLLRHLGKVDELSVEQLLRLCCRLHETKDSLGVNLACRIAADLARQGCEQQALEVLKVLREEYLKIGIGLRDQAQLGAMIALLQNRLGQVNESLREAAQAWVSQDHFRYGTGSPTIRATAFATGSLARYCAMFSASEMNDWTLLAELIESSRLQAQPDFEGSSEELSQALEGVPLPVRERNPKRVIAIDHVPEPFHQLYVDHVLARTSPVARRSYVAMGDESFLAKIDRCIQHDAALPPPAIINAHDQVRKVAGSNDYQWLSYWCERGVVFWVLWRNRRAVSGGKISVKKRRDLVAALVAASVENGISSPWPAEGVDVPNFSQALTSADTPEETVLTSSLAELLPNQVKQSTNPNLLLISEAPELAVVPWPILPLSTDQSPARRLIDSYELRFMPSVTALVDINILAVYSSEERQFMISVDCIEPDPFPRDPRPAKWALGSQAHVQDHSNVILATPDNVARILIGVEPGEAALAFFRTHYNIYVDNPSSSGFTLVNGILPAAMFSAFEREKPGLSVIKLPSRVILSCCSTSGIRGRSGGETLGMVAVALRAGSHSIYATAIDVKDTVFTGVLDDILIEAALRSSDPFSAFRAIQVKLLDEWRTHSLLGTTEREKEGWTSRPDIWAYYQAFGVETIKLGEINYDRSSS